MKQYIKAIDKKFGYLGNWLPTTPLAVGDVGTWTADGFSRLKGLRSIGPSFKTRAGDLSGDLSHRSVHSAEMKTAGEGAGIEASFTFKSRGQFVFQAKACTSIAIDTDLSQLEQFCRAGHWKTNWILITEVVRAEKASIVLSRSSEGSIRLAGPTGLNDLVDAKVMVSASTGEVTEFLGQANIIPMFRAVQLSRAFLGGHKVERVTRSADPVGRERAPDGFGFDVVTGDDLFGDE